MLIRKINKFLYKHFKIDRSDFKESYNSETFCILPWIHSFVNLGGELQICCTSEELDNNIYADNKALNIKDQKTLVEIYNSDFMNNLRLSMIDGQWFPACKRCKTSEDNGAQSRRIQENQLWEHLIPNAIDNTLPDGSLKEIEIKTLDYRLGNLCNLKCQMCNPRATIQWLDTWNQVKTTGEAFSDEFIESFKNYDWFESEYLLEEFKSKVKTIEVLHFAGGEPLLIKKMACLLQICIDEGAAQNITIQYNTNLTVLPAHIIEKWKSFKQVKILVSIDSVGERNEYIRRPSKWENIRRNLDFLDANASSYNIKRVTFSCTVQAYNIFYIDELFDFTLNSFQSNSFIKYPKLSFLQNPQNLSTKILPIELKGMVQEKLNNLKNKVDDKNAQNNIQEMITFMNSEDHSHLFKEFLDFNKKTDKNSNYNLEKAFPIFSSYKASGKDLDKPY